MSTEPVQWSEGGTCIRERESVWKKERASQRKGHLSCALRNEGNLSEGTEGERREGGREACRQRN